MKIKIKNVFDIRRVPKAKPLNVEFLNKLTKIYEESMESESQYN